MQKLLVKIGLGILLIEIVAHIVVLHVRINRLERAMGADTLSIDNNAPPAVQPAPAPSNDDRKRQPYSYPEGTI